MQVLQAAMHYINAGYSVIPVVGKAPAITSWKPYTSRIATSTEVRTWFGRKVTGVALVSGAVSGNLVILDLDGDNAINLFREYFPGYWNTYRVKSPNGMHLYYRPRELPNTTRGTNLADGTVKEIGLRARDCYTVAPPSLHPSGMRYKADNGLPIMRPAKMLDVVAFIIELIQQKKDGGGTPPAAAPTTPAHDRVQRYVRSAVRREVQAVQYAPDGSRNDTLNRAAFVLARLMADPESGLNRAYVEAQLESAAATLATTDGIGSVRATIKSGIDAGLLSPRTIRNELR